MIGMGNHEMIGHISRQGGTIASMWANRQTNTIQLYRVCSAQEAVNTWFYCLAGGQYRHLTRTAPSEDQAVEQVGNNEGMPSSGGKDPRLAMLAKLGIKPSTPPPRAVVEYSLRPADQFFGVTIRIMVNKDFLAKGSNLSFEGGGGWIAQIGTPLAMVQIPDDLVGTVHPAYDQALNA